MSDVPVERWTFPSAGASGRNKSPGLRLRFKHGPERAREIESILERVFGWQASWLGSMADADFWEHDPAAVEPAVVTLRASDESCEFRFPLDAQRCRELRAELCGGPPAGTWLSNALARLVQPLRPQPPRSVGTTPVFEPLFVGHACVSWTDGSRRLWIDPFLRPKRDGYPRWFTPLSPLDVSEEHHAVLLTHAHPDHFDPGSLFWFPNDTHFVVPFVERETPLTLRLDVRLRQLGFTNISVWAGMKRSRSATSR